MKPGNFDDLIRLIDQMIDTAEPRQGEYYRGYREGRRLHHLAGRTIEQFNRYKSYKESGDPYLDSYIRGFTDGCKGVTPESLSELFKTFKAS